MYAYLGLILGILAFSLSISNFIQFKFASKSDRLHRAFMTGLLTFASFVFMVNPESVLTGPDNYANIQMLWPLVIAMCLQAKLFLWAYAIFCMKLPYWGQGKA